MGRKVARKHTKMLTLEVIGEPKGDHSSHYFSHLALPPFLLRPFLALVITTEILIHNKNNYKDFVLFLKKKKTGLLQSTEWVQFLND